MLIVFSITRKDYRHFYCRDPAVNKISVHLRLPPMAWPSLIGRGESVSDFFEIFMFFVVKKFFSFLFFTFYFPLCVLSVRSPKDCGLCGFVVKISNNKSQIINTPPSHTKIFTSKKSQPIICS